MKYLIVIILILFTSCGSMKKHTEESNTNKESNISSNLQLGYELDRYSLEPVNLDRPILVGGKEYHNTKIVVEKETGTLAQETKIAEAVSAENKETEKERDNTLLYLGIAAIFFFFLFLLIFGVLFFLFKKIDSVTQVISALK